MTSIASKKITCAAFTFDLGARPGGSAALSPAGILLIEWPRPWPSHIERIPALQPVHELAKKYGIKVLLVHQKRDLLVEEPHSVILYRPLQPSDVSRVEPSQTPRPWRGTERYGQRNDIVDIACDLLHQHGTNELSNDGASNGSSNIIDLLVCTHGARDRCCGRDGSRLALDLIAQHTNPSLRIWQASHLGGHRFAPTATVLPQGTSWAYLDASTILQIVDQSLDPAVAVAHFRGSVMWPDHGPQTVDIDGFVEFGWDWLNAPRTATNQGDQTWSVHDHTLDRSVTGRVATQSYNVPPCGSDPQTDYDFDEFNEYYVERDSPVPLPTQSRISG